MKKLSLIFVFTALMLAAPLAQAHSPICDCSDNGDETITCEGGFSDGSSASGVKMAVIDDSGKLILEGKMNQDSEYTFEKPKADYTVVFDAGNGHKIEIDGKNIVE